MQQAFEHGYDHYQGPSQWYESWYLEQQEGNSTSTFIFKMFYGCGGSFGSFLNISKFKLYGHFYDPRKVWKMAYGSHTHAHLSGFGFWIPSRGPPGILGFVRTVGYSHMALKRAPGWVEDSLNLVFVGFLNAQEKDRTIGEALAFMANAVCKNWIYIARSSGISIFASSRGCRRAHMILI